MRDKSALERLTELFPLKQRQDSLSVDHRRIHQRILRSLAMDQFAELMNGSDDLREVLQTLAEQDLIVLNESGTAVVGAYPVTMEKTPHKVVIKDYCIYAMCALDAVSIAPMFDVEVKIHSVCQVTGESVVIRQDGVDILEIQPSRDVMIGIRWQQPQICAAHSLCTEMVFLKDKNTSKQWQNGDRNSVSLLTLNDAISVGKRFFLPLWED